MEKTIFHIDVNSAYLSWEAIYRKPCCKSQELTLNILVNRNHESGKMEILYPKDGNHLKAA